MSYEGLNKALVLDWFEKHDHPHVLKYARPALDGDVEAAFTLSHTLSGVELGSVAVAMWRCKVPRPAYRAYFSSVWMHNHREVEAAAKTRRTLAYMFRYAAFKLPAELPDVVTVWRGSSAMPFDATRTGYAWTTDRDIACWFAMRFAEHNGSPLVLTADIAKCDIALFTNERSESEAVLMRPPAARIDGDVSDWTACCERQQKVMDTRRKAMFPSANTVTA